MWIPAKCVRPHLVRSNAEARSNAGARSNVSSAICAGALAIHRFQAAPSLFSAVERTLCGRTQYVRTYVLRSNALGRSLAYIKDPRPFGRIEFFGGVFGEHFASILLVPLLLFVSFYFTFNFNALFQSNYALLFNEWLNSSTEVEDEASPLVYILCFYILCFIFRYLIPYSSFNFCDKLLNGCALLTL
jgi:hypothetical protein